MANNSSDNDSLSSTQLGQRSAAHSDTFYDTRTVTIFVQNMAGDVFRLDDINVNRAVSYLKYKLAQMIPGYNMNGIRLMEMSPTYPNGFRVLRNWEIVSNLINPNEPLQMYYEDSFFSDEKDRSMYSTYDTYMNQFKRGGNTSGKKDKMRRSLKKLRRSLKKLLRSLPH